jgi:flagellar basal-body rod modification protein FlgD
MTVSATSQTTAPQSLSNAALRTGTTGADFNMFLKLLTTQMQNQDPLDPMKTNEYTQQLAQYTQIEQTVQQSGTLKDILARLSTQDMAQASGMIGREAVFNTATSGLDGEPARWAFAPARAVNSLVATITDANGLLVDKRTVDATTANGRFSWDGRLAGGASAPRGSYTLAMTATDTSGGTVPVSINSLGTISSVNQSNGTLALVVNGADLPMSSLQSISAPGAS